MTRKALFIDDATNAIDLNINADQVDIADAGGYYTSSDVEGALQEIGAGGIGGGGGFGVAIETPAGTIDGANDTFTLSSAPDPPEDLLLFKNGLFMEQDVDYTLTTDTIVYDAAQIPETGDNHIAGLPATVTGAVSSIAKSGDTPLTGDVTLSEGTGVTLTQAGNDIEIAASTAAGPGATELVYRYTVTGSDKASIDTGSDTPDAGSNDWTNGDVLEIFTYLRTDEAVQDSTVRLTFNNDTGGNYDRHYAIIATGLLAGDTAAGTFCAFGANGASSTANYFATENVRVANYMSTVGYKTIELFESEVNLAASGVVGLNVYVYRSTSALSRLAIQPDTSGKKFKVGSQLLIYKRLAS